MNNYLYGNIEVEAKEFNNSMKNIVFTWVSCNKIADFEDGEEVLRIHTPIGYKTAKFGDYVIKIKEGIFLVCKKEVFKHNYRRIDGE